MGITIARDTGSMNRLSRSIHGENDRPEHVQSLRHTRYVSGPVRRGCCISHIEGFRTEDEAKLTVVGHDMRTSGPALLGPVMQGLMDEGSDCINIGLTTTPMYYYAVCVLNADAGIQITASHNPEQYNGVKLVGPKAIPAIDYVSNQDLYDIANRGDFPSRRGSERSARLYRW